MASAAPALPSWLAGWHFLFIFGFLLVTDWDRCPLSICRTCCFGKILFSTAVITGPGERAAPAA
jgi:hypothetical protein